MAALVATVGNHFSHLLHHLVYSFPSPNTTFFGQSILHDVNTGLSEAGRGQASGSSLEEMVKEPGEPRALAGGVGPLSFVGSGYGVMLILMVYHSISITRTRFLSHTDQGLLRVYY